MATAKSKHLHPLYVAESSRLGCAGSPSGYFLARPCMRPTPTQVIFNQSPTPGQSCTLIYRVYLVYSLDAATMFRLFAHIVGKQTHHQSSVILPASRWFADIVPPEVHPAWLLGTVVLHVAHVVGRGGVPQ